MFGRAIPVYGLLLVVAAAAAWFVITLLAKKRKWISSSDASLVFLIGISGGLVGAILLRPLIRIVEVAISWERFAVVPAGILLHYIFGEIVFYGGLIGGLIAIVLFCRKFKIGIVAFFEIAAPALALAHAIGRIGCFFGGCCYGIELPHGHPLSIVYPPFSVNAPPGVPLLAIPLIEASYLFVLFIVLTILCLKVKKPGLCASIYLLAYPAGRFVLEFFRGDIIRGNYGHLTTSQYISFLIFAFGIIYFIRILRINSRQAHEK